MTTCNKNSYLGLVVIIIHHHFYIANQPTKTLKTPKNTALLASETNTYYCSIHTIQQSLAPFLAKTTPGRSRGGGGVSFSTWKYIYSESFPNKPIPLSHPSYSTYSITSNLVFLQGKKCPPPPRMHSQTAQRGNFVGPILWTITCTMCTHGKSFVGNQRKPIKIVTCQQRQIAYMHIDTESRFSEHEYEWFNSHQR